jgi:hypothetical protein
MIHLKIALATSAILSLVVAGTGFTVQQPTVTSTFYLDNSAGVTQGPITPGTQVLIQSEITSTDNWITTSQIGGSGNCLNSITFDQEPGNVSDGIGDGQYSLQEAINAVWAEYLRENFDLPTNGNSFTPPGSGASAITIGRASCP